MTIRLFSERRVIYMPYELLENIKKIEKDKQETQIVKRKWDLKLLIRNYAVLCSSRNNNPIITRKDVRNLLNQSAVVEKNLWYSEESVVNDVRVGEIAKSIFRRVGKNAYVLSNKYHEELKRILSELETEKTKKSQKKKGE